MERRRGGGRRDVRERGVSLVHMATRPQQPEYLATFSGLARLQTRSLRARIRTAARHLALSARACSPAFGPRPPSLRLLYCHYVFDDQRAKFEDLISALKAAGTFVNTETCLRMLRGEAPIDATHFHLSFDDGFRNIFTNAIPILMKHGVPAEVFVPTGIVEASHTKARDYCRDVVHQPGAIELIMWSDLRQAAAMGFGVSSHTRTHARLSTLSDSGPALADEILGSKSDIEDRLGRPCRYTSWTYGSRADVSERALDVVRGAGYEACFGAFRGAVIPGRTDIFAIPRHHFEPQWPIAHVKFFAGGGHEPPMP